jgi:hypothetical protein
MGLQEGMKKRIGGGRYFERSSIEHKIRRESISEMKTVKKKGFESPEELACLPWP